MSAFAGRVAVVTGAGTGIGRALAVALSQAGARVCVADLDADAAAAVADETGGVPWSGDLRRAKAVPDMIAQAEAALGPVEILISNAGRASGGLGPPEQAQDSLWQDAWDLHVMAHLRAARAVLPGMQARRQGWLVNVASAAGLLCQIGDAPYSASKHAAVSLAQSLAIDHGADGIAVSVVCPLYVATGMLGYAPGEATAKGVLQPDSVAKAVLTGMAERRFLILPHPEAAEHFRRRAADMDRWIRGMQRLRAETCGPDTPDLATLHRKI
jgi:NAD(P)-dependent dehydrogenase (short-subunit alcohol dehydrogenase family)